MSDLDGVRRFEYRPSRIAAGIDVEFKTGGETIQGSCKDVSDTGIRASFDGSVVVGGSGVLTLRHAIGVLALEAQVAYMDKSQVGLTFLFKTNWEREITAEYNRRRRGANRRHVSSIKRALHRAGFVVKKNAYGRSNSYAPPS